MLQAMKSKAATWVIRVLAVFLIISFAAWGVGDMITGRGLPTEVADVGNTKVTAREFNQRFRREMDRLRAVFGSQLDSDQARRLGIADSTVEALISRRLLALKAQDLGLIVDDGQIRQYILGEKNFFGPTGKFDESTFRQVLVRNGMTEDGYVDSLRNDILQSSLTDLISQGSVAPRYLTDILFRYRNEKRIATLVIVTRDSTGPAPTPTDVDLRQYHKKYAGLFTAPELRDVTAIHLSPARLAEEIKPSEGQLRDEFKNRLASLTIPERRRLRQILVQDEAAARRASALLDQGRSFSDVAMEVAGQEAEATQLGLYEFDDLPRELAEIAFKLDAGKAGQPIRDPLGWHILLVEKIEPGKVPTFAEARDAISADLAREMAVDGLVKLANRLEDSLAGGADLEQAAAEIDATPIRAFAIDATGRTLSGVKLSGFPKDAKFLETAFGIGLGQPSDMIETREGGYFIVRVDKVTEPKLKPLDSVRADVEIAWQRGRQDEAASKLAAEILKQVKAGSSLARVAEKRRLELITSKPFTRFNRAVGSKVPPALAPELFDVPRGAVAMGPSEEGYAVAQVKDIQPAIMSADKEGFEELRKQIRTGVGDDVLAQFSMALRKDYPVEIDQGAIDRLFNTGGASRF